jgi:hypothetical protein
VGIRLCRYKYSAPNHAPKHSNNIGKGMRKASNYEL